MIMGLPLRCRYWSVLQVVATVVCYRGKVYSEMVEGCVGSPLSLRCEETKVINITAVIVGDSYGIGAVCYIRDNDCTRNANAYHTMDVQRRCDGRSNCTVDVIKEMIPCGFLGSSKNDFERITYICMDEPRKATVSVSSRPDATETNFYTREYSPENERTNDDMMNSTDEESIENNRNTDSESAEKSHEEPTTTQDNSDNFASTDGTLANLFNNIKAGPTTLKYSERAQDCVRSRLNLSCPEMKVIEVIDVVLGNSNCYLKPCCIKDNDCTRNANQNHTTDVHRTCDNKQGCTVEVLQEKIPCWYRGFSSNNDFERITYICIDEPRRTTVSDSSRPDASHATETNLYTTEYSPENERRNETKPVVMAIICLINLLAIVVLVVIMYRKKLICAKVRLFHPVAMTEVENRQNETDVSASETHGTSLYESDDPLSLYSLIDEAEFPKTAENPAVYSEVRLKETVWNDGQSDRVTTDKTKAAFEAHTEGPDVYAVVNKTSKTPATSSTLKTDQVGGKGLVNMGDCFPDQIYSLASNDMEDIYANETTVESSTQLAAEGVSKTPSPQDDEAQTVIENDLYCH